MLAASLLANGERGAGVSSFFFSSPSLFFPFSSLVLGWGFCFGFGVSPSPFFLRHPFCFFLTGVAGLYKSSRHTICLDLLVHERTFRLKLNAPEPVRP